MEHTAPPPGQHLNILRAHLWFLQWERRAQDGHPAPPALQVTSWESTLLSHFMGNMEDLTSRNLIVTEKGDRVCSNQCSDLGQPSSYLLWPRSSSN